MLSPLYYIDVQKKGAHPGQVGLTDPYIKKGQRKLFTMKFLKRIKQIFCCSMPHHAPASQGWEGDQVTCTCFLAPPGTRSIVPCSQGGTGSGIGTRPSNSRY